MSDERISKGIKTAAQSPPGLRPKVHSLAALISAHSISYLPHKIRHVEENPQLLLP